MRILAAVALVGCGRVSFDARRDATIDVGDMADAPLPEPPGIDADITSGLVAYWPFEGPIDDVVGGHVGTCGAQNCPTGTVGRIGSNATVFDGVDDCVDVADDGAFQLPILTIAVWARQESAGTQSQTSKRVGGGSVNSWQLETDPLGTAPLALSFTTYDNGGLNQYAKSPNNSIVTGTWQHLAATYDGADKRLYIDGALVATMPQSVPLPYDSSSIKIGCDDNQPLAEFFHGALDDLRFYDRVLTDSEIAALAAQ